LIGESIGGTAAIAFALQHPRRVLSLTLSNAAARGGLVSNVAGWREIVAQGGQAGWAQFMMQSRFHPGALPAEQFDWFMSVHQRCSMAACFKLADLLLASDLSDRLEQIAAPTLLLAPDASPFIPLEVMVDMRRRLPQAELQVFAHAKHGLPLSHGEACAKVLRAFLSQLP
jgi:pimeloyl-ACP methyl ester carboxylesterase